MANQIRYQVGFDVQQNNLNQLKSSLQQLQKMKIGDIMKINDADAASARAALDNIKQQVVKVEDALKAAFNTKLNTVNIETFNQSLRSAGTSVEQIYQAFRAAGTTGENAFRSLSSQVLSTNIQLKETHGLLDKMATTLANTVKWNAASAAVNTMSRSVEQAYGYVKSLDTSLNDIRIVTGKSADEMANFAVQANEAAKSLGKTTTDYTNAALIYAQQGLSDKEIEQRAKITLKTANVTGQSTSEVSEQLTAVWNGYKVNAQQAELYVDRLAAVAATTASDLEELSTGMSKVASAAAAMGVGEDQLAAQLSTIISVTRQAPESVGAALRTIYARISDIQAGIAEDGATLGYYSGKMAEFGINVLDANGNLRDMGTVMQEIGGKWDTMTREQQIYLAQTMAGQRQYNTLVALFDNFADYNKALETAQNAAGTLQEQQDTYMESTNAHLQVLRASIEDIYDSLINTDSLNGLIDGLASVAELTSNFVDGIGGGGAVLRALGAIGVTVFSEQIAKGINTTITNFEIAKSNAEQFDAALQATRQWQGIPELDEVSQSLLQNREQLLDLARMMSPDQFTGLQTLLNDMTAVGNELATLTDKQSFLDEAIQSVTGYADSWEGLQTVLKDTSAQEKIIERIQEQETAFKEAAQGLKTYSDQLKNLGKNAIQGKDITGDLASARQELQAYIDKLRQMADQGQLERHKDQVASLEQQLQQLDDSLPASEMLAKLQLIAAQLRGISTNAGTAAAEMRQSLETEFGQTAESIGQQIEALIAKMRSMQGSFDTEADRAQRATAIEGYAKMAGGIAQVGMAIQQVQNLGSIWKNSDLSTGEKLLQTITNLAMSIPMLITGFQKAATVINLMSVMTNEAAVAAGYSTAAQASHAASLGLVTTAAGSAAIKIQLLNHTLLLNPFVALTAVILGAVTAFGIFTSAAEQANQALIDQSQASIEKQNQIQEEIEAQKELYTTLEQLDKQVQNGEITRGQLKETIQDLIDQYGLEGQAADNLAHSYGNLADYIKNAREEAAKEAEESAKRELSAARDEVESTARGDAFDAGAKTGNAYSLNISAGAAGAHGLLADEPVQIEQMLKDAGAIPDMSGSGSDFTFMVDFDTDSIIELYDTIQSIVDKANELRDSGEITASELSSSEYYNNMNDWLTQMKDSVEHYRDALQDVAKYQTELTAITATNQGGVDFSNVETANDYLRERLALVTEIQKVLDEKGDTTSDAGAMADTYLRDNFRTLYTQFEEAADYIEAARQKFGGTSKSIEQLVGALDENQFAALLSIDPETITTWQKLGKVCQQIAELDFSNLDVVNGFDIDALQQIASADYNKYQSLQEQVEGGKTISAKEYKDLDPQLQQFFSYMANGSLKMTGDAEEFYETVNNLKLDGFHQTIAAIDDELSKLSQLAQNKFDYNDLNQTAYDQGANYELPNSDKTTDVNYDLVDQQLAYLSAVTDSNDALSVQIDLWRDMAEHHQLSLENVQNIAAEIENAGDQTSDLDERMQDLAENAMVVGHQLHDAMFPTDEDIDLDSLEALTDIFQDIADESEDLSDDLSDNAAAAQDLAEAVLRFDDACVDVVDNYEDWMDALESGSIQDQADAIAGLRDAYADLLDLDGSSLSNDFLTNTENLDLMRAAIDGDIEAYDELMARAGQDIIAHMDLDHEQFDADLANVQAELDAMNFQELEIGANLDTGNFLQACTDLVNNAGMTAQQATDYLASMGVDAEVVQTKTTANDVHEYTGAEAHVTTETVEGTDPITGQPMTYKFPSVSYTTVPVQGVDTQDNTAFSLKVISANKSSGGGFKFANASNGGGSKGAARRAPSGGGRKGGGGGGGGKGAEPDTSQKDLKKALEDERDIYHDINIELDQINRNLDRTQKKQDRLYGKQLLDNLNKQQKILEQHKETLEEKQKLQQQDLKSQQATLKNLGVTFDKYGNIKNYMDILLQKQSEINGLIKEENSLIEAYNASTDKEIKQQIADQIEAAEKRVKNAEDEYKDLQDKIGNYDDLREQMEDLVDQIEDETQQQIEIEISKFRMELEIRLQMGEAERDWNEFKRKILDKTDIIKDTDFSGIFKDAKQNFDDIFSYFNVHGGKGSIEMLTEQLLDTREQIEQIDKTGSSAIYGDNKAQAMEDLQDDLDELMDQMQDIEDLIDDIDKAYLDTIDDIDEQFSKQIDDYEFVNDLLQHDMDLLELLYGEKNYDAMDKYYTTLAENNKETVDSLKKQSEFWKEQWDKAAADGDTQAAAKFKQNYMNTIRDLNSAIEQGAQNLQNKYLNAINKIFDTLDKKVSNGFGTDYLSMEWQLMNKNADEYLDTINTAFAIQETQRKYQNALNDAKSIKSQQALKKLMDEQLGILKAKEKVTQYDIDRAEKMLQIEQARIALEDAQAAKTSMRLKRDSQGNYSYEYVADGDTIEDAESNLAAAQNDLYNFDKDRYQSNLNDILSAWQEFQERYKEIVTDTSLTEEERVKQLALLREAYGEYINDKTAENEVIRTNLMESAFMDIAAIYDTDVENYENMTEEEKNLLMNDLVPMWDSGVQQMTDKVAGQGGFIPTCQDAFDELTQATEDYKLELDDLADTAGVDLTDVQNGVDDLAYSFMDLVEENDELIDRMYQEMDAITDLRADVQALRDDYASVYDAAKQAVSGIHEFIQAQQQQAAQEAANANKGSNSGGAEPAQPTQPSDKGKNNKDNKGKGDNGSTPSSTTVEGIAGNIWVYGTWGDDPTRHSNMIAKFGKEQGDKIYAAVQAKFNSGYGYNGGLEHDWDYYKKFSLSSFRSGGYTGVWAGENGKIGILHQKEMVLNEDDTRNLLNTVSVLRSVMSSLGGTMSARLADIKSGFDNTLNGTGETVEQRVHIEASFPNVDSKREIEEAFDDLVNLAAQRAMRR